MDSCKFSTADIMGAENFDFAFKFSIMEAQWVCFVFVAYCGLYSVVCQELKWHRADVLFMGWHSGIFWVHHRWNWQTDVRGWKGREVENISHYNTVVYILSTFNYFDWLIDWLIDEMVNGLIEPFLCATAATAVARLSHRSSVRTASVCPFIRLSICHLGGSVKNGAS